MTESDTPARMSADEVWAVWRRLLAQLPMWRMPQEWFFSPSIYTLVRLDMVSGLLRNRSTRRILEVLAPLAPVELRRIHALAALNNRRHEVISRWMALGFVTLPASAALTLSELAPAALASVTASRGLATWYFVLGYAGAVVACYLLLAWRARQLLTIVELAFIRRGVSLQGDDGGAPSEPIAQPLGA